MVGTINYIFKDHLVDDVSTQMKLSGAGNIWGRIRKISYIIESCNNFLIKIKIIEKKNVLKKIIQKIYKKKV